MNQVTRGGSSFVGYDYKEAAVEREKSSMYIDGYMNFGWILNEELKPSAYRGGNHTGKVIIKLKRDRKILHKTELTRLERHFEACMSELAVMEKSKTSFAVMWALVIAMTGTAFMAGSVFAVTHDPPKILLSILLAVPAFAGWTLPVFVHKAIVRQRMKLMEPLMEQKYDEIYEVCEKGNRLLS
ncbi:hypothetical protein [Paenibacillus sp. MMS20-IR301]|uniref:hypothetical protein n=1 Tax=Paenibacillus sp. MMS20-IR301 TaxID=2895946 RepID=UPI0028F05FE9|nr:hypothetical protein [Paenibacillus sp. MMS20-IR301]WNS43922.1 hypothetical protein LOS79_01260 [Paenibacillus sp. MMS20-IR301]